MTWNHLFGSGFARQIESEANFIVNYRSRNVQTIEDVELVPAPGGDRKWSPEELAGLKEDFWSYWQNERHRFELALLIRREFFGENFRVASAISRMTGKSVSARTIQSWLIEPGKPSNRKCPAWAVKALQDFLADPENKQDLAETAKYRADFPKEVDHLEEICDKREVELATHAIARDHLALEGWRKADFNSLPIKLFELEKRFDRYLDHVSHTVSTITNALDRCENFDDLKKAVKKELRQAEVIDFEISSVRKAIEEEQEEFSNDEGLPKVKG